MNKHPPKDIKTRFRRRLLQWYRKHKRDLPWRQTGDPYAIWVSEIMLQQTQVATVIPYFQRFLKRFPTLRHLSRASEEEVLSIWSGLGYYRRARLLHRGTQYVLSQLRGKIPKTSEALKKIPSIGDYTAGAIASIAFDQATPLVDGNVIRVYARVFAEKGHAKAAELKKKIWQIAEDMMGPKNPGDFNQALMELGATLCRVNLPSCERCPVAEVCQAYLKGLPDAFPETPPPKGRTVSLQRLAAICQKRKQILLIKKQDPRWFRGLWELPHDFRDESSSERGLKYLVQFLKEDLGLAFRDPRPLGPTRHNITHHRITTQAWSGQVTGRIKRNNYYENIKFFPITRLETLALSNFDRKVLQMGDLIP